MNAGLLWYCVSSPNSWLLVAWIYILWPGTQAGRAETSHLHSLGRQLLLYEHVEWLPAEDPAHIIFCRDPVAGPCRGGLHKLYGCIRWSPICKFGHDRPPGICLAVGQTEVKEYCLKEYANQKEMTRIMWINVHRKILVVVLYGWVYEPTVPIGLGLFTELDTKTSPIELFSDFSERWYSSFKCRRNYLSKIIN